MKGAGRDALPLFSMFEPCHYIRLLPLPPLPLSASRFFPPACSPTIIDGESKVTVSDR